MAIRPFWLDPIIDKFTGRILSNRNDEAIPNTVELLPSESDRANNNRPFSASPIPLCIEDSILNQTIQDENDNSITYIGEDLIDLLTRHLWKRL